MQDERAFLHSIASPITAISFLAEVTIENMAAHPGTHPEDIDRLNKIMESVTQLEKLLTNRRAEITKS